MKEPTSIDVSGFIKANITRYDGDWAFLAGATEKTLKLWDKIQALQAEEIRKGGLLDVDPSIPSTITSFGPGFIDEELDDVCVGLQTDKPLKRAIKPCGGINMVNASLQAYGYEPDPEVSRLHAKPFVLFLLFLLEIELGH